MAMAGELVTESFEYDGGRKVTVYVPPRPPEAIVFSGDGHLLAPWGADLESTDLPPTMFVGAHRVGDEEKRIHEYSPKFDPELFAAHESFFVHDVRTWVHSRFGMDLPRERTAMFGVSASGELALAMAMRHPDIYGVVLCASPGGGYHPPAELPSPLPRVYLYSGTEEPWFGENAKRWDVALRDAGGDVVITERAGNHGDPFWRAELPTLIAWAFA